jgi:hypothetical protein
MGDVVGLDEAWLVHGQHRNMRQGESDLDLEEKQYGMRELVGSLA